MTVEKNEIQFEEKPMTLEELIKSNPDPRELKRALAVKMRHERGCVPVVEDDDLSRTAL